MSNNYQEIDGHKLTDFIHELPFYLGNIMKYAWRAPYKGVIDDTLKLLDYLDMARRLWVKYDLSYGTFKHLQALSSYEFYSNCDGVERAHRECIRYAAELIMKSDISNSINEEGKNNLIISVGLLQVALTRK